MADPQRTNTSAATQRCVGCLAAAPDPEEGSTLRSSYGWRFMRETLPDGRMAARWHCPSCWQKKKREQKPR